jgi:Glyoxalase-like domain
MALARYKDLCIDVSDARASGEYWSTMLGWGLELHDDGDAHLRDDAGRIQVWLNVVPEPKSVKNRVHIDVNAESVERAVEAGATVQQEYPRWTVMLDPDGQEHCVFPRQDPVEKRAYELGWDCTDDAQAHQLAEWWADVVGGSVGDDPEHGYCWVQDIPECVWESFDFNGVPEPKSAKNRIHIDVTTDDVDALVAHGATVLRAKGDGGLGWTIMADPAGNEFCAFTE